MWLFVALMIVLTLFGLTFSQAPDDADPFCTETLPGVGVNILDYAPQVKPLMDSRHYQNLLPPHANATWQRVDNDNNNPSDTTTNWIQNTNLDCRNIAFVCGFSAGSQDNWMITQHISRVVGSTALPQVTVQVDFRLNSCTDLNNCRPTFSIQKYETSTINATAARDLSNYELVTPRITPSDGSGTVRENTSIEIDFATAATGLYLAFRDETTCVSVHRVLVFYYVCPAETSNLITRPEIIAPHIGNSAPFLVDGQCVNNSSPENGVRARLTCSQNGVWGGIDGDGCVCDTGFQRSLDGRSCVGCDAGMYLSINVTCLPCPANSNSSQRGLSECPCFAGYFRAVGDPPEKECSLPQPTSTSLGYVPSPLQTPRTAKQLLDPGQIAGIVVAAVAFSLLFLVIVPLIIFCLRVQRHYTRKQEETIIDGKTTLSNSAYMESTFQQTPQTSAETLDTANPERAPTTQTDTTTRSTVSEQLRLLPQNLVIHGSCIKLLKSVGEGAFGIVYKAHYSRHEGAVVETVAVKSLKAIFTSGDLQNLVKEIQLMQYFDHPNVMPLLGVCLNAGCFEAESAPCLVMPYMENGSLLTYLRKAKKALVLPKDATSKQVEPVQRELFKMCYEIALGMNYLAEKKFVHRDLSARNCMMGSDRTMKVADFGLAEDIYTKNYFRVDTSEPIAVPFKWMPLESLQEGIYNEKTDMWSFGITTWEIFSGGMIPYTAMSAREVLQLLKNGGRLDKPESAACSEEIYTMMLECWDEDPKKRPCFLQVVTTLSQILQTVSGYLDLNQLPPLQPPDDPTNSPSRIEEAPPGLTTPIEM